MASNTFYPVLHRVDEERGLPQAPSSAILPGTHHKQHDYDALSSTSSQVSQDFKKTTAFFGAAAAQAPTTRLSPCSPKTWTLKIKILALTSLLLVLAAITIGIAVPLVHKKETRFAAATTDRSTPKKGEAIYVNAPQTSLIDANLALRIMPLGASITYGLLSTDGNGYREDLLGLLARGGNTNATYVGSRRNGTMRDNAVEGWPGLRIDQVWAKAAVSVPADQPNVILINAGTNDCVQNWNLDSTNTTLHDGAADPKFTAAPDITVGGRMRILVNDLFVWAPNTTVVLSTLVDNKGAETQTRVNDANAQFREVAKALQAEGKSVVLAEMTPAAGGPNSTTMADGTHPNDVGYAMMANVWYEAMTQAGKAGLIKALH